MHYYIQYSKLTYNTVPLLYLSYNGGYVKPIYWWSASRLGRKRTELGGKSKNKKEYFLGWARKHPSKKKSRGDNEEEKRFNVDKEGCLISDYRLIYIIIVTNCNL